MSLFGNKQKTYYVRLTGKEIGILERNLSGGELRDFRKRMKEPAPMKTKEVIKKVYVDRPKTKEELDREQREIEELAWIMSEDECYRE